MTGVAALLAAATAAYLAARWLEAPALPFLLAAGVALSAAYPVPGGLLEDGLVLGVSVLLFVAGLELEPGRIGDRGRAAIRVGLVQALVLAGLGFAVCLTLGFTPVEAGYLALALTASSTLVGVRILKRRREMFEPYGRVVLGVLLLQDVLVLLAIPLVTRLGPAGGAAAETLGAIALLGAACAAVRRWGAPLLARADEELLILASLSTLFLFGWGAELLGVPLVVGAFLAGVALARFPVNRMVRSEVAPIGEFFSALFFTALGALVRVPSAAELWQAGLLAALVLAVTPPLVTAVAERSGLSSRSALDAGLLLSQTSELSLVIGLAGMVQGDLDPGVFTVIVLVTATTMLLTPLLAGDAVSRRLLRLHPSQWRTPEGTAPAGHVLLLGGGTTGRTLLEGLSRSEAEVVVVDRDASVTAALRSRGVRAICGEASDPRILEAAGAGRARVVVSTLGRASDSQAVLAAVEPGTEVLVRVDTVEEARKIREWGGTPVLLSERAAESLMEWYDRSAADLDRRLAERAGPSSGSS